MKTKGQQLQVAKPELLALTFPCPCSSDQIERLPTKLKDAGSSPARGFRFKGPARSINCQRGFTSGLR